MATPVGVNQEDGRTGMAQVIRVAVIADLPKERVDLRSFIT